MNSYRNSRSYENLEKRNFKGAGSFGIPELQPTQFNGNCDFVSFNYALGTKDRENKGVHFFIDDYQFKRLWTKVDRYVDMLSQFKYVMTPDFSTYTDFPKAMQIYNHFRKHWIGAYLQEQGIDVISTISWSTPDSFEWCFDGEPKGGCVAVSSVGCSNIKAKKELFLIGYEEMIKRLQPKTVIFYGTVPEECQGNIVSIKAFSERFKGEISNGR